MEVSMTVDASRLETALKESKETNLTDTVFETSSDAPSSLKNQTQQVCRICGKVLEDSPAVACENCFTVSDEEIIEAANKRDSGFHTMNRESADESQPQSNCNETILNGHLKYSQETPLDKHCINLQDHKEQHRHHIKNQVPGRAKDQIPAKEFAENLFNCNGYKRTEVARILGKNSQYNQQVAKEYLKFFDFTDDPLINSYRYFLSQFALLGETQERERVLSHFSARYVECNPHFLDKNPDTIHTLVCALTLLNTDLHGSLGISGRKKMTYKQFVSNLSGLMSNGDDYPKDLLVSLYTSIKKSPLPWGGKEQRTVSRSSSVKHKSHQEFVRAPGKMVNRSMSTRTPGKPRKTAVDSSRNGLGRSAKLRPLTENHGTLWRKTVLDADGKKVPMGKRGWRVYTVTLRNLELHIAKKGTGEVKTVSIHHTLAEEATTETKRANVFKLTHADSSVALYQASSEREMRHWIRDINKTAALLSAAPLCSPVGSQLVFRKPLLPSAPSTLPPTNQVKKLQQLLKEQETDLTDASKSRDKGSNADSSSRSEQYLTDKINYLKYEIKKYKCYVEILNTHLHADSSRHDEPKSNLDESENESLVSVTPSEPPLASPSAIDTFNNLAFPDTPEKVPVLSAPTHFTTPQHRPSALSPTSSLPNLSPILESPAILQRGNNKGVKIRTAGLYESSLNDGDLVTVNNVNNSNAAVRLVAGNYARRHNIVNPSVADISYRSSSDEDVPQPRTRAEIQTTVIGMTALPGGHKPFPVKRYEMRIANMDHCESADIESRRVLPYADDLVNKNLTRVKGRKEKKGIERYSYMQAVSPLEHLN